MYLFTPTGGCSTLLHLFVQRPLLVLVLGLGGMLAYAGSPSHAGDAHGANGWFAHAEQQILKEHPRSAADLERAKAAFDGMPDVELTAEQVRYVLSYTDACTDRNVADVMHDPQLRRQVAWLYFLDASSKRGIAAAADEIRSQKLRGRPPNTG